MNPSGKRGTESRLVIRIRRGSAGVSWIARCVPKIAGAPGQHRDMQPNAK